MAATFPRGLLDRFECNSRRIRPMQTGEQITLIFALFTVLLTLAVVVYYKFCKHSKPTYKSTNSTIQMMTRRGNENHRFSSSATITIVHHIGQHILIMNSSPVS
ncbi:hypothetical protein DICVIV_10265 [Dictyocaulus viviparus]|uniref:Uncharacterized protein n=1 Tax=Dictyocaulus viviparus TaxID=29172 RepID=A0A0D8XMX5_DICVI|nr:hypothetical protein DICVIV_10265 [Dictyocaulus viviparus]